MDQQSVIEFLPVDQSNAPFFASLAFPNQREEFAAFDAAGNFSAVGARLGNLPVGLALAQLSPGLAVLQSLMVLPGYRNRGVATHLLADLEKALTAQGFAVCEAVFADRSPATPALERIFERSGWPPPQAIFRVYRGQVPDPTDYPWMSAAYAPPEGFEVFPWTDLAGPELAALKERLRSDVRYRGAHVGVLKEDFEPRTSLGLRFAGEVVGWCFTSLVPGNKLLYYEGYFVRPDMRRFGHVSLGQCLISNVIYRHRELRAEMPNFGFSVDLENPLMLRFAARFFEPFCSEVYHLKRTRKVLTA